MDPITQKGYDFLQHKGVIGMKWGHRRRTVPVASSTKPGVAPPKQRRMSNKELTSRIKRLKLEKEYDQLTTVPKPATVSKIEKLVKTAGTVAALTGSAATIYKNFNEISKLAKPKGA